MSTLPILVPSEVKKQFSVPFKTLDFLHEARKSARRIVSGEDKRTAFITGPCSVHDRVSALEYAGRLKALADEVSETCFLVMRVYIEKSRTSTGWKGMLYDPYLDGSHDMHTGLLWTRELLLAIAELGIPIAAEFVDPLAAIYFEDLVTWGFIGARTSASQPHRQFASSLEIPIGFKNSTDGALDDAIHGIAASRAQHTFLSIDPEGRLSMMRSHGNSYTHMVLRGAHDFTNYDAESINYALLRLQRAHLSSRLVIDCSHGNCQREHGKQRDVFHSVLQQLEEGNRAICGLMLESHLTDGYQSLTTDLSCVKYDISITDPCIDWQTTENLIRLAHYSLSSSSPIISVN